MSKQTELHSSLYQSDGWNTNPMHKGQECHRLKRQDAEPIQGAVDPSWCLDKQGTPMAKGPNGLLQPARAFATLADFMTGFAGFTPYPMNQNANVDGSPDTCTTSAKPQCESIVPCGAWRADVKTPDIFCVGQMFKLCPDPENEGDIAGNLGDCLVEPTDDPAEAIGALEKFESGFVCLEDGTWELSGNVGTVLLRAGVDFKKGIVPPQPQDG